MSKSEQEKQSDPAAFLSAKKVFYVGSPTDDTVLVAVHPEYLEQARRLSWWDTVKERIKLVKAIKVGEEPPMVQVVDRHNTAYVFLPLSLELYNNVVKNQLFGKREFATEEDMVQAFEETLKSEN